MLPGLSCFQLTRGGAIWHITPSSFGCTYRANHSYPWYTVWLQISVVEYFRDFCEFGYDHENFCYKIFLTAASSTALDTSKSRKTSESQKSGKIQKLKTTEIWSHTVTITCTTSDGRYQDFKFDMILSTCNNVSIRNSCNMGTSALPDMYAQSPRAEGIHIRHTYQAKHECPCCN